MKKLTLKLDQLAVESFATSLSAGPRGTVQAHATELGDTCEAVNSCGPETCGALYCIIETDNANLCGGSGAGCSGGCSFGCPSNGCVSGQPISCVGCTTYDYTVNPAHDSCGLCASFESDAPQRCRCV
jgi:hypothetical protein